MSVRIAQEALQQLVLSRSQLNQAISAPHSVSCEIQSRK
jgi:hypothetical protein